MYKLWENPPVFNFDLLKPYDNKIISGFTGRTLSNKTQSPYGDFNQALHVGDDSETVITGRRDLCQILGLPFENYTCADQVHGSQIQIIKAEHRGSGRLDSKKAISATDGLITDQKNILLNIFTADCVPIILYDHHLHKGGVIHAGWRGTTSLIVQKGLIAMIETWGSRPSDILACMGPSIGSCCYEIGEETEAELNKSFSYSSSIITRGEPSRPGRSGIRIDLKKANGEQLEDLGVPKEQIEISPICSCCEKSDFYSYRGDSGKTGRTSTFLMLK